MQPRSRVTAVAATLLPVQLAAIAGLALAVQLDGHATAPPAAHYSMWGLLALAAVLLGAQPRARTSEAERSQRSDMPAIA